MPKIVPKIDIVLEWEALESLKILCQSIPIAIHPLELLQASKFACSVIVGRLLFLNCISPHKSNNDLTRDNVKGQWWLKFWCMVYEFLHTEILSPTILQMIGLICVVTLRWRPIRIVFHTLACCSFMVFRRSGRQYSRRSTRVISSLRYGLMMQRMFITP